MKKLLLLFTLIVASIPAYAQPIFTPHTASTSGIYVLANLGIMPMYDISGAKYDISTNGLGNNGTVFGATLGMSSDSIAYEISYSYNSYLMTSALTVDSTTLGSKYEVYSQDFKAYALYQPSIPTRSGSSAAPYIGVGVIYSKLNIDVAVPTLPHSKSNHTAYGLGAKAGVRLLMSPMIMDFGVEYEHKPFKDDGLTENTVKAIFGVGLLF